MIGSSSDIDISVANIWQAWRLFRKGKRSSYEIEVFEYDLEKNILLLACDLQDYSYRHGSYRQFIVNDSKKRLIAVASIRDRVVHRLLYEYLVDIFDKTFIYDVWSCRPNKGLLGAIERTKHHTRSYCDGWIWRSDVQKFFDNINRDILKKLIRNRVKGDIANYLLNGVIDSYGPGRKTGVPIGNLTSQIFANIYLNELDRFVVHIIRPLGYVRYGDDMVLWLFNAPEAQLAAIMVKEFLISKLGLKANSNNTVLQPTNQKLRYLGVELWPKGRRLDTRMRFRIRKRLTADNYESYSAILSHHGTKRDIIRLRHDMIDYLDKI
ncbi:MAG TPA: reverse transcriptase/maturase family protein [Candidatus Saccharimonadales bacterium]|nr:reverse transcriptase/maturase family protein [Candidatus Saccharimonadales bacterium]